MKVFVFGSNLSGHHGKGAALEAKLNWGARQGVGIGLQGIGPKGTSYALPTKGLRTIEGKYPILPLKTVQSNIVQFLRMARIWWTQSREGVGNESVFLVTRIGCGLAGYTNEQIAPIFLTALDNCEFDPAWAPWGLKSWTEAP